MSVIKGCSFAVRVSTDPLILMPEKIKQPTMVDAEKTKAQVVRELSIQHTFQRHPVK